jgi:flagellar motility protein MotE (MotC chaperone)
VGAVLRVIGVFTALAGRLPLTPPPEAVAVEVSAEEPEAPAVNPIVGSQIGLVDELVESLQVAHEELTEAKLRLDKREKNLQELYASYLKLRQETEVLMADLEDRLVKVDDDELNNFKKLSAVYSKMEPGSAAQSLKHMEAERVALILSQMDSRAMAAIMNEAVSAAVDGSESVAQWSDAIRRLNDGAEATK